MSPNISSMAKWLMSKSNDKNRDVRLHDSFNVSGMLSQSSIIQIYNFERVIIQYIYFIVVVDI